MSVAKRVASTPSGHSRAASTKMGMKDSCVKTKATPCQDAILYFVMCNSMFRVAWVQHKLTKTHVRMRFRVLSGVGSTIRNCTPKV